MRKTIIALTGLVTASTVAVPLIGKTMTPKVRAAGTGEISINDTNFPDTGFREYIRGFDTDQNGILTEAERKKVTEINFEEYEADIYDLTGIEYFTSLKILDCSGRDLRSKGLDLSENTDLEVLSCSSCSLLKLDLQHNARLTDLYCMDNVIQNIEFSGNPKLEEVYIGSPQLVRIDVGKCPKLKLLSIASSKLSKLDLSNNSALEYLSISEAILSELDVAVCPELTTLDLNGLTKMTMIDLSNNPKLRIFGCDDTPLKNLDLSHNTGLTVLTCINCGFNELDLSKFSELEILYCDENPIRSLDLSNNTKLEHLTCASTALTELDLSSCSKLHDLDVSYTKIKKLNAADIRNVSELSINGTSIEDLNYADMTSLQGLYFREAGIETLDVSGCKNLQQLYCDGGKIRNLNLTGCRELFWLTCDRNQLETLDLSNCAKMLVLGCEDNNLQTLDVSMCPLLYALDCERNHLENLDLSHNPNLSVLDAGQNALKNIDLSHLKELKEVYLALNYLTEPPKTTCNPLMFFYPQIQHLQVMNLKLGVRTADAIRIRWQSYQKLVEEEGVYLHFEIWRSTAEDSGFEKIGDKIGSDDGDVYEDRTARSSVTYYYKVRASYKDKYEHITYGDFSNVLKVDKNAGEGGSFEDFVERLYTVALGRDSEPEGKEFWVKQVVEEGKTGADCARFFLLDADEFMKRNLSVVDFVETLYATFFNRDSDEVGKKGWIDAISSGKKTRAEVVNDFIESTEWCDVCAYYGVKSGAKYHKATKASVNAINFATRLYTCCLKRDAEEGGLKYWSLALTNLDQTGAQAAQFFFEGDEFVGFKTSDEEYLKRLYTTFMDREPATEEVSYWIGEIKAGRQTRHSILAFFAQSKEFTGICKKYGIDRGEIS